tara:strand:- start:509 stop:724 length:216 start_codon:yes stop_codon:yes gene_type:complete
MKNKKVKQMMLSVGALDVPKIVNIYTVNNIRSSLSGKSLPFNMVGGAELEKILKRTYDMSKLRGWFKDYNL